MKLYNHSLFSLFCIGCLLFTLISCDVNDTNNFKKIYSYKIRKNAAIALNTTSPKASTNNLNAVNFTVVDGDSTVFIYHFKSIPPEGAMDGGFFEEMVFQIPANVEEFEYRDNELAKVKAYYRYSCRCDGSGIGYNATKGFIEGRQLNKNEWHIQANVTFLNQADTFLVKFEKPFTVDLDN